MINSLYFAHFISRICVLKYIVRLSLFLCVTFMNENFYLLIFNALLVNDISRFSCPRGCQHARPNWLKATESLLHALNVWCSRPTIYWPCIGYIITIKNEVAMLRPAIVNLIVLGVDLMQLNSMPTITSSFLLWLIIILRSCQFELIREWLLLLYSGVVTSSFTSKPVI